jgi:hypothetical protein
VLKTKKPSLSEYVPSGQAVQVASAEDFDPPGPYWPVAQKEPEHVEVPVICTSIYKNIHICTCIHVLCIVTHRRILCMFSVVPKTQTHSTHTLSTPAVSWYLPGLQSVQA